MLYFPQLSTGALTQLPFIKSRFSGTISNLSADGRILKVPDFGSSEIGWELRHNGMTDAELEDLAAFFELAEGRLNTFTFLDPSANLLFWSEYPAANVWTKGPMLRFSSTNDPLGTSRAVTITNTGGADQALEQVIAAPGWFQYCFSFHARSSVRADVRVFRSSGGQVQVESALVENTWTRVMVSGNFDVTDETVSFGIRLTPGQSVDVFGLQVEAQPNPSPYRRSTSRSGVYPNARFAEDSLRISSDHLNQHNAAIRIVAVTGN